MKKSLVFLLLIMNVFSISFFTSAHEPASAQVNPQINTQIKVSAGYAKESIPGTSISAAYMTITNKSDQEIKLIGAKSRLSDRIEIHQHLMADGMMKMRQTDFLSIAANDSAILQPSGYHLMIFDLKKALTDGETLAITLYFDNQTSVTVTLPIQGLKQKHSHHHH